jgi:signal transduction histidine kinase/HAMP domain-containing protein
MFARTGLSSRLNIIVITINFVVFMLVGVLANVSSSAALRRQAVDRFIGKNNEVAAHMNSTLSTLTQDVAALSASLSDVPDLTDSDALRFHVLEFLSTRQNLGLITRISIARPDDAMGVVYFEDPADAGNYIWRVYRLPLDTSAYPFLEQAYQADEPTWLRQEAAYNDTLERSVVSLVYPYTHEQGNHVVWIDIPLTTLSAYMTTTLNAHGLLSDTKNGYVILTDQHFLPLTEHHVPQGIDVESTVQTILDTHMAEHRGASGLFSNPDPFNNNATGLFSIQHLANSSWYIVDVLPENEIPVLPYDILAPIVLVAAIGLIVLIVAVNRFIDRSVVQPLVDLGRSATEIGEGNLRFIVFHQDKQDEIGRLANALDGMRSRLKESYDELQSWSRNLEERVDTRTQQLALAQKRAEENAVQLRAVYDESLSVVHETQLRPVLDIFIERVVTLFNATYCAVWLLTPERNHIQLVATNDLRRQSDGLVTMNVDEGIVGQAISRLEPIIVDDYASYEHRIIIANDGSLPFARGVCAPLLFAGQPVGAVVVGRSESGDKFTANDERYLTLFANMVSPSVRNAQLMVQLQAAVDEAHRANEVKTRFLASVTHELRTPLNLVINNMDFMRVGAFGDVTDEQISRLNQTVRSAEHLLYLINDLLDVSKIEAGEMQLFIQMNDIATLLEDAVDNAQAMIDTSEGKENVELRVEIEDDLPEEVPMDSRRIRQVLNNLLSNAIKFTEQGIVTLKVFRVESGIHFSVHDTGMGIPSEEMELLFAAFERTSTAKQHGIEGTGLGLPISRFLVQQHGSDLTVASEIGAGSTFAFTLPYKTPENLTVLGPTDTQQITAILSSRNQ